VQETEGKQARVDEGATEGGEGGGDLEIRSAPGAGTTVTDWVPVGALELVG
jgi:hypothetical protein